MLKQIAFWLTLALVFFLFMFPLYWILISSFKTRADVINTVPSYVPYLQFNPTLDNYRDVFFTQGVQSGEGSTVNASADVSQFRDRLINSVIITGASTALAVLVGTLTAYAVSRFSIPLENDFMFFLTYRPTASR